MLLLLYTLWMSAVIAVTPEMDSVVRENYGVVFTPTAILDNAHSNWHHTFGYKLKLDPLPNITKYCSSNSGIPHRRGRIQSLMEQDFCPAFRSYNDRIEDITKEIYEMDNVINILIPKDNSRRKRRGLFDIVGKVSKTLFGTATTEDTEVMLSQVNRLRDLTKNQKDRLMFVEKNLHSFMLKSIERDTYLEKNLWMTKEMLQSAINVNSKRITEITESTRNWINILHLYGTQVSDTLVDIRYALSREVQAIQTLLEGYLPVYLVPPTVLRDVLDNIRSKIMQYGAFRLAHDNPSHYYSLKDISYYRDDDMLYLSVKIPLTSTNTVFTVYRVYGVPIVLGENRSEKSIINFEKPYMAISNNFMFYLMLSEAEFQSCTGNTLKRCSRGLAMKEISNPNCAVALFLGDQDKIKQVCDYTLLPNVKELQTNIVNIKPNLYFISTDDLTWLQTCVGGTPMHVKACSLCTISVPCGCSLKANTFYIPATLDHCNSTLLPITYVSHNLPALYAFYGNQKAFQNLTRFEKNRDQSSVTFPDIPIVKENFSDVFEKSEDLKLSLLETAEALRNGETIYGDGVSKLTDNLGYLVYPVVNKGLQMLVGLLTIGVVAALVLSIKNYYLLLLLARPVEMFKFNEITPEAPTVSGNTMLEKPVCMALGVLLILLILLMICLFYLLIKNFITYKEWRNSKFKSYTEIHVALYDGSRRLSLKLSTIPYAISDLTINPTTACPKPKFKRKCLSGQLKFDWSQIQITKRCNGSKVLLPNKLKIGFYKSIVTSSLLPKLLNMQLFITNGKDVHEFENFNYAPIKPMKNLRYRNLLARDELNDPDQALSDPVELQID